MGVRTAAIIIAVLLSAATPAAADTIYLPRPQSEQLNGSELFEMLGAPRDRLPAATVPGGTSNDERVDVAVRGDGSIQEVHDQQWILLGGMGDYFIRESGPAESAVALGDESPVLDFGDVVWQGFSTGGRKLGADLALVPQIEATHLPLRISVSFTGSPIGPDGTVSGPGTVTLTVTNTTRQTTVLPTAADAPAGPVGSALDRVLAAAHDSAERLPTVRTILPTALHVTKASTRRSTQLVPLRLRGTLSVSGEQVKLDGLLSGRRTFTLEVDDAGQLALDLSATPALDPATLQPPDGFRSWSAWAAANPPAAQRRSALDLLIQTAATGVRASAYSPYLGPQLGPAGSTIFHYTFAQQPSPAVATPVLKPRPFPIALTIFAGLLIASGGVVLWRRS